MFIHSIKSNEMDPSITSKIRKFIAVAPPFAGADELIDVYLNGMHGFDFEIKIGKVEIFKVNYDVFGQYMFYKAVPIITELRPHHSLMNYLLQKSIRNLEKQCVKE